jgi:hypothetical protein
MLVISSQFVLYFKGLWNVQSIKYEMSYQENDTNGYMIFTQILIATTATQEEIVKQCQAGTFPKISRNDQFTSISIPCLKDNHTSKITNREIIKSWQLPSIKDTEGRLRAFWQFGDRVT